MWSNDTFTTREKKNMWRSDQGHVLRHCYPGPFFLNFKSYLPSKKVYLSRMTVRENLEPWGPFFESPGKFRARKQIFKSKYKE